MSAVLSLMVGIVFGVLLILIVGLLAIQALGVQAGAIFDLSNTVVAVASPQLPFLQLLAVAALGGLALYLLLVVAPRMRLTARLLFVTGVTVALIAGISLAFTLLPVRGADGGLPQGVRQGWRGWLEEGAVNPAVHIILLVSVWALWGAISAVRVSRRESHRETSA